MKRNTNLRPAEEYMINLMRQKDDKVFIILYENYWSSLMNFAENYIKDQDTCKEIVQELIIALYLLHKQHQYTLKKTSEILSRPVDTVEKHFRKAIHILRDQLTER